MPNQTDVQAVRTLVRARMDFQGLRKAMSNRIGKKADGTNQNINDGRSFMETDINNFISIAAEAEKQEKVVQRMLEKTLKRFPIYTEYLEHVSGVGTISAGWIIGEFNIHTATTVSKMWQYAGLNPGMVRGKKRITQAQHKGEPVVKEVLGKDGKTDLIVLTNEMVKGDRPTKEFVLPYNKNLRTALVEVMTNSMIKLQAPLCMEYYYPYKDRLAQSSNTVKHMGKEKAWKDVSPAHRNRAAKRYMVKMFLKDLYPVWREIEGLPVRVSYQEEYLGHKHTI